MNVTERIELLEEALRYVRTRDMPGPWDGGEWDYDRDLGVVPVLCPTCRERIRVALGETGRPVRPRVEDQ